MAAENKGLELKGKVGTEDRALGVEDIKIKAKDVMSLLKNVCVKGIQCQELKSGENHHLRNGSGKDSNDGNIVFHLFKPFHKSNERN